MSNNLDIVIECLVGTYAYLVHFLNFYMVEFETSSPNIA